MPLNCGGCLLVGIAHLAIGLLFLGLFAITAGYFLTAVDTLSQVDAIVVLAGNVSRGRHAVYLFNQGCAPVVVFSNATLEEVGLDCSWAQLSLEAAQELGLPSGASIIADEAQSTYDEAVNLRRLAQERGWRSLIVVTDPFHTRRAGRTFRTLLPDATIYLSAAPDPNHDPRRWWQTEQGLVAVFNEVLKLAFYWARYGISPF